MFFAYAEKQGSIFSDAWQIRQLAFDTMRRYLYYSAAVRDDFVAASNGNEDPMKPLPRAQSPDSIAHTRFDSPTQTSWTGWPASPVAARPYARTPPQPNDPKEVAWRRKIKVDGIVQVAKEHVFALDDPHVSEEDLFQVEIHGESRQMAPGESPSPGPLLCPAAGLAGLPARFSIENEDYIRDPFFLRELYENLRDQFNNLRIERERVEMASGRKPNDWQSSRIRTLQSPRRKGGSFQLGSRVKIVVRFRTDYEYRRFWYVVQTVLGYDKLCSRPYRGLPPYDPRNGLIFGQIPMYIWQTFRSLDRGVFYTFMRCDVAGKSADGEPIIFLRGAWLVISHDAVLVMRDAANIPRWVRLQDIHTLYYSYASHKPYLAFLCDHGAPDIVLLPQAPSFGPEAIRHYNPAVETLRVRHVMHEICFASLDIRRVIDIREAPEPTARAFIHHMEEQQGHPMQLEQPADYADGMRCPLPQEPLAQVWRGVQAAYAARDPIAVSRAAIPLYENNTNDVPISSQQLGQLSRWMSRERASVDDIVGLSYDEIQQVEAQLEARRRHDHRTHSHNESGSPHGSRHGHSHDRLSLEGLTAAERRHDSHRHHQSRRHSNRHHSHSPRRDRAGALRRVQTAGTPLRPSATQHESSPSSTVAESATDMPPRTSPETNSAAGAQGRFSDGHATASFPAQPLPFLRASNSTSTIATTATTIATATTNASPTAIPAPLSSEERSPHYRPSRAQHHRQSGSATASRGDAASASSETMGAITLTSPAHAATLASVPATASPTTNPSAAAGRGNPLEQPAVLTVRHSASNLLGDGTSRITVAPALAAFGASYPSPLTPHAETTHAHASVNVGGHHTRSLTTHSPTRRGPVSAHEDDATATNTTTTTTTTSRQLQQQHRQEQDEVPGSANAYSIASSSSSRSRSGSTTPSDSSGEESEESDYVVPGSRYVTRAEVEGLVPLPFDNVVEERHAIVCDEHTNEYYHPAPPVTTATTTAASASSTSSSAVMAHTERAARNANTTARTTVTRASARDASRASPDRTCGSTPRTERSPEAVARSSHTSVERSRGAAVATAPSVSSCSSRQVQTVERRQRQPSDSASRRLPQTVHSPRRPSDGSRRSSLQGNAAVDT